MKNFKKKISIIGLGYVGLPTFLILSNLKKNNRFLYNISGIEKNEKIKKKFEKKINWINSSDKKFNKLFKNSSNRKDISITTDISKIKYSDIIIVSIGFEARKKNLDLTF